MILLCPLATIWAGKIISEQLSIIRNVMALKESEHRLQSTMDNMMAGCQIIGHDWRYIYLNDAAEKHSRRPNQELLNNQFAETWPGIKKTKLFSLI